jgi:hypothetical protein
MPEKHFNDKRVAGYTVDMRAGYYRYVNVEGVGECREQFMKLVNDIEQGKFDIVIVASVQLLFVDTSPMWMEKFIATVKQHFVLITDATSGKDYDLRKSEDEIAFRALEKNKPGA